jgi:type I restriction enzyme S subunit
MFKQIEGLTNSSSQGNIGMGDIEKLMIDFPTSLDEQNAISNILLDIDNEIEQLIINKTKFQSIKQGMMQELLTGKTRLI